MGLLNKYHVMVKSSNRDSVKLVREDMDYNVRAMQAGDITQVKEIDREAFPTQWPPPNFNKDLNNEMIRYLVAIKENGDINSQYKTKESRIEANLPGLLSRIRGIFDKKSFFDKGMGTQNSYNILGYAAMWLMVDEAHVTSIAVRESHRRRGIGELLLISIIDRATQLKAQVVTLEVRESNLVAQALYEKYGFIKVGVRRGYYSDDGEDAVIMTTENITSFLYQTRLQELRQKYEERMGGEEQRLLEKQVL